MPKFGNRELSLWECCYAFLCPPCPSKITSKIAFAPPKATYDLCPDATYQKYEIVLSRQVDPTGGSDLGEYEVWYTKTKTGSRISVLFLKSPKDAKYTILYSHGNNQDLGIIYKNIIQLRKATSCNVLAYDYSGFGRSNGRHSERNMYKDIEAVWSNSADRIGLDPANVILYGYSIGSVPTIHLANLIRAAGVVLHSPIASACRMLCRCGCPCDTFNNASKIAAIQCPVLVIHGTSDKTVDVRQGRELYNKCSKPVEPLWLTGADHDNIEENEGYYTRLVKFINEEL